MPRMRAPGRLAFCLGILLVLAMELGVFNLAHWQSMGAGSLIGAGQAQADPELGPGLKALQGGGLLVTDPAGAWIQVGSPSRRSGFIRVETSNPAGGDKPDEIPERIHVRLDARYSHPRGWVRGGSGLVVDRLDRTHYLRNSARPTQEGSSLTALRLWIQEPEGSRLPIGTFTPDVQVPLSINPVRLIAMVALILMIAAFLPGSRLWRIPLDAKSGRQRLALTLALTPLLAWAAWSILHEMATFVPGDFHHPNSYVYDFNQYDHVAQALLQGRPWLNMDQAPGLAQAHNPYDIATRNALLAQDQKPIYWDYVYWQGHWYSYFGVLPAVLIFMPYRALTSLFHPGGYALSTAAAASFLVTLATVMTILMVIRLLARHFPGISLATTALALVTILTGSNMAHLWCRKNFYTLPFDAALLTLMTGLWIWLGARRVRAEGGHTRMWTLADGGTWLPDSRDQGRGWHLSKWRIFLGSLCVAATLGCRPTFLVAGLLAIPIFSQEIKAMTGSLRHGSEKTADRGTRPSGGTPAGILGVALLPLPIVAAPLLWYNHWRFGSILNFGNRYQMTVVDLTHYHPDLGSLPGIFGYYLFQPLTTRTAFPYLQNSPAPLSIWHYTEPGIGGLLVIAPVILVCLTLLCSARVRRDLNDRNLSGLVIVPLPLALILMALDSYLGGFSDRYMLDFAWLLALVSVLVLATRDRLGQGIPDRPQKDPDEGGSKAERAVPILLVLSCLVSVVLMVGYALVLFSHFETSLFTTIEVWFTLL